MKKVLIATEKPFAPAAKDQIIEILKKHDLEPRLLEKYTDKQQLLDAVKDVTAIIIRSDKVDKEVLEAASELKVVARAGAGYDNVDCATAKERGVCVMNTPGQNSNAVAELVLGLLVYLFRNQYNGKSGHELKGRKIGILAFGNVGRNVARIAKGFDMEVYAYDQFLSSDKIKEAGVNPVNSKEELFEVCDIVSLHIPKTKETINSINAQLLSKMPEGACLINTARKEVVDEEGIRQFMIDRPDFMYITDIMPDNHAEMEKFEGRYFSTPKKMGAQTAEANINAGKAAAEQIAEYLKTGSSPFQVNK